jgi:hypothetical protein
MIEKNELESREVWQLAEDAEAYLLEAPWCFSIRSTKMAWSLAPKIGVFAITIEPANPDIIAEFWVIVGDLPPAYLPLERALHWQDALELYCNGMQMWVDAVREGRSVAELIPVAVAPTMDHADLLQLRLDFIRNHFLNVEEQDIPGTT